MNSVESSLLTEKNDAMACNSQDVGCEVNVQHNVTTQKFYVLV